MISACPFALTPELVIAIATAALAIATGALAFVTARMARETRNMAETATKALALEQMPILGLRSLKTETTSQPGQQITLASIRVGMELFNAGRVPVKYKVKSISVTLSNQHTSTGEFASTGSKILPGASSIFWHPMLTFNPPISEFPINGKARCDYEYSDGLGGQLQSVSEKVTYTVSATQSGFYVNWLHVD